jgi:hypothetical protein
MSDEPQKVAGIVVYTRNGNTLEGCWTHRDIQGKFGRDVVTVGAAAGIAGSWPVDIYMPDQTDKFFSGQLDITPLGSFVLLKWTGTANGTPMSFAGIGFCPDPNTIGATFQQVS